LVIAYLHLINTNFIEERVLIHFGIITYQDPDPRSGKNETATFVNKSGLAMFFLTLKEAQSEQKIESGTDI
jgi:hypothetical protein